MLPYNGHGGDVQDMLLQQFNHHFGLGPVSPPERVSVGIVKGPLGFGFSLSEFFVTKVHTPNVTRGKEKKRTEKAMNEPGISVNDAPGMCRR